MEDLRDFGSELTKNTLPPPPRPPFPPRIGTSHGGLRTSGLSLPRTPAPTPHI